MNVRLDTCRLNKKHTPGFSELVNFEHFIDFSQRRYKIFPGFDRSHVKVCLSRDLWDRKRLWAVMFSEKTGIDSEYVIPDCVHRWFYRQVSSEIGFNALRQKFLQCWLASRNSGVRSPAARWSCITNVSHDHTHNYNHQLHNSTHGRLLRFYLAAINTYPFLALLKI